MTLAHALAQETERRADDAEDAPAGETQPMTQPWCASVVIYGPASSQGSKRAFLPKGGTRPVLVDDDARLKDWRGTLTLLMRQKRPAAPLDGPVHVEVRVVVKRPKSHFRLGRFANELRVGMPTRPTTGRDLDKVARACLDAGTHAGWWVDDRRVCELLVIRRYAMDGTPEGVYVDADLLR